MVVSAIALVLGVALVYFEVTGLRSCTTKDKGGNEVTGGTAKLNSGARLVGGLAAIGFAIYTAINGVG